MVSLVGGAGCEDDEGDAESDNGAGSNGGQDYFYGKVKVTSKKLLSERGMKLLQLHGRDDPSGLDNGETIFIQIRAVFKRYYTTCTVRQTPVVSTLPQSSFPF